MPSFVDTDLRSQWVADIWGLRDEEVGAGLVDIGEDKGVDICGGCHAWGGVQAPADCLCGSAEFPPAGVGFWAVHHHGH